MIIDATKVQAKKQTDIIYGNLKAAMFTATSISQKQYNFEFTVQQNSDRVKILVYFGKKGVKVILQGDDSSSFYKLINSIVFDQQSLDLVDKKIDEEPDEYVGSDEAGKGDIFGPLVIAALYVNQTTSKQLVKIGVRDSKDLADSQISFIASKIKSIVQDNFHILCLEPKQYNQVYERYHNLNKLLSWAHSKAIEKTFDNKKAFCVITDKFSNSGLEIQRNKKFSDVNFILTEKGERFIAVAAASILARDTFVKWFDIQRTTLGIDLPKGSSLSTIELAKSIQKKYPLEFVQSIAKTHFKVFK